MTEEYATYVEGTVTGFIKKFPLDVEKLRGLVAAKEYKQNCQRPMGVCQIVRGSYLKNSSLLSRTGEIV